MNPDPVKPSRLRRMIVLMAATTVALMAFAGNATATHLGCDHHPDGQCGTPPPVSTPIVVGNSLSSGDIRWSQWPVPAQKFNVYINGRYTATVRRWGPSPMASMRLPSRNRYSGTIYVIPIARSVAGREWIGLRHEAVVSYYRWTGRKYETVRLRRGA